MDVKALDYVIKSKVRFYTLINLKNGSKTPTELSKETGFHISHISKTVKDLEKKGFVVCKDGAVRKNKLYEITSKGKMILNFLSKITSTD